MKEKKWKIIKRTLVCKTRIVKVYQDKVVLPNGAKIDDYTIVEKPSYVKVVPMDKRGRVLLSREYRHAVQRYLWEVCGGFIDNGESPVRAARREIAEETGFTTGKFKFIGTMSDYGSTDTHTGYIVLATDLGGRREQRLEETETITKTRFVTIPQLKKMIAEDKIESSSTLGALAISGVLF